jgi:superfamily I DNA and/or RNA helicase
MTVDKAQGSEADAVILSLVKIGAGFMQDPKRANVALSRAKRLSVLVGWRFFMRLPACVFPCLCELMESKSSQANQITISKTD